VYADLLVGVPEADIELEMITQSVVGVDQVELSERCIVHVDLEVVGLEDEPQDQHDDADGDEDGGEGPEDGAEQAVGGYLV